MIKVKILDPVKDRNEPTFRPFTFLQNLLKDYSIEFTNSDDFLLVIILIVADILYCCCFIC